MQEKFQKVYKKSALKYCSSRIPNGEISHDYEVLDVKKTKLYDQEGKQVIKEDGEADDSDSPTGIFAMSFGKGGRMQGGRRGKHVVHHLSVTLGYLYDGTMRNLALQKNGTCDQREGQGVKR